MANVQDDGGLSTVGTETKGMSVRCRQIPGRLNVLADKLSRQGQTLNTEWSLSQQVFNDIWDNWETPHVGLFATRHNKKFPVFVSPVPNSTAWAVDVLSLSW